MAHCVQERLVTLGMAMSGRKRQGDLEPAYPAPDVRLMAAIEASGHDVVRGRTCLHCRACGTGVLLDDGMDGALAWLARACLCAPVAVMQPVPLDFGSRGIVMLGEKSVHCTHRLWAYRGMVCCAGCGLHGGMRASPGLQGPCVGARRTLYAQKSWSLFRQGRLPPGTSAWPFDKGYWYRA